MAGPLFDGVVQFTDRLSVVPAVAVTEGAAGRSGGSMTLVSVIVTAMVSVPPLSSSAFSVTA